MPHREASPAGVALVKGLGLCQLVLKCVVSVGSGLRCGGGSLSHDEVDNEEEESEIKL